MRMQRRPLPGHFERSLRLSRMVWSDLRKSRISYLDWRGPNGDLVDLDKRIHPRKHTISKAVFKGFQGAFGGANVPVPSCHVYIFEFVTARLAAVSTGVRTFSWLQNGAESPAVQKSAWQCTPYGGIGWIVGALYGSRRIGKSSTRWIFKSSVDPLCVQRQNWLAAGDVSDVEGLKCYVNAKHRTIAHEHNASQAKSVSRLVARYRAARKPLARLVGDGLLCLKATCKAVEGETAEEFCQFLMRLMILVKIVIDRHAARSQVSFDNHISSIPGIVHDLKY